MRRIAIIAIVPLLIAAGFKTSGIIRSYHFSQENLTISDLVVSSASPPAIDMGVSHGQPFLVAPSANSVLTGKAGINGSDALANLVHRASFESWGGAGDATGWTETTTAGDGSAAIAEESTEIAHGSASVKITLTGTTSSAELVSNCQTTGIGSDVVVSGYVKKSGGTSDSSIVLREYDTAACGTLLASNTIYSGDVSTSWSKKWLKVAAATWNASTSSYQIALIEACDGGCDTYWDGISCRETANPADTYSFCNTDATCWTTEYVPYTVSNPLTVSNWTIKGSGQSPIAMSEATYLYILNSPGTSGSNNRVFVYYGNGSFICRIYSGAGVAKTSSVSASVAADTEFTWQVGHRQEDGAVFCCLDGTCDASPDTGADMDGVGTNLYFGGPSSTDGRGGWISDAVFYRRILP